MYFRNSELSDRFYKFIDNWTIIRIVICCHWYRWRGCW